MASFRGIEVFNNTLRISENATNQKHQLFFNKNTCLFFLACWRAWPQSYLMTDDDVMSDDGTNLR